MVRLVFRPYTQILRSICTSESLRASTRVSSGFTLFRHSSPSFGSQHICSTSDASQKIRSGRRCLPPFRRGSQLSLSLCTRVYHPNTRRHVRLLGPCFKTGRLKPLCQHKHRRSMLYHPISITVYETGAITLPKEPHSPRTLPSNQHERWPIHKEMHPGRKSQG